MKRMTSILAAAVLPLAASLSLFLAAACGGGDSGETTTPAAHATPAAANPVPADPVPADAAADPAAAEPAGEEPAPATDTACPAEPPIADPTCSSPGLTCEYRDPRRVSCVCSEAGSFTCTE